MNKLPSPTPDEAMARADALARLGDHAAAVAILRELTTRQPKLGAGWRALADQLHARGSLPAADAAYGRYLRAAIGEPILDEAARAISLGRWAPAEAALHGWLDDHPTDVRALALLGRGLRDQGHLEEAEPLLTVCADRHPSLEGLLLELAHVQRSLGREREAVARLEALLKRAPGDSAAKALLASCLGALGESARSIKLLQSMAGQAKDDRGYWVSYGRALVAEGRRDGAIEAYRRAIALAPLHGEAWYRLAEIKTAPFTAEDTAAMRRALADPRADALTRVNLFYALARAREDADDPAEAFRLYTQGAQLNRSRLPWYDRDGAAKLRRATEARLDGVFFADRAGFGAEDPAPIFVVGLPRCGSTLVEQILASHSAVEGTGELTYLARIERSLGGRDASGFPGEGLADLTAETARSLGETYLAQAGVHRRLGRPRFVDKNLGNFQHVGLIQLILPGARIIDVRRHPMASGVALSRHLLGPGWTFACGLEDIGSFYREYVALMDHFDAVLPGRVCRVIYEDLVEDTEGQVRRLLEHCGLPFDAACLRPHETARAVLTPSAEQVRRPIYRDGLDHWRRFEPWLGPLREALGPALETWRGHPA